MRRAILRLAALALVLAANPVALAAERVPADPPAGRALTGKERLGRKWTDEQRVDDCKVPADRRGTRERPTGCATAPSS